jgi:hypothetical protein
MENVQPVLSIIKRKKVVKTMSGGQDIMHKIKLVLTSSLLFQAINGIWITGQYPLMLHTQATT